MAEAIFVKEGYHIDYTPTSDVAAGQVIDLGTCVGVATRPIAANELGALQVQGVYDMLKFAGEAIALFATVYWDEGTNTATGTVAYSEAKAGICIKAALAADTTVRVLIVPSTA
jgi:predicted RecA/RadA family phage recombinase